MRTDSLLNNTRTPAEISVGPFVVLRSSAGPATPYPVYSITYRETPLREQITIPSLSECIDAAAIARVERRISAGIWREIESECIANNKTITRAKTRALLVNHAYRAPVKKPFNQCETRLRCMVCHQFQPESNFYRTGNNHGREKCCKGCRDGGANLVQQAQLNRRKSKGEKS